MTREGVLGDSPPPRTAPRDSAYLPGAPDDPVSGDSSGHPSPARPQPPRAPSGSRGPEATQGPRAGGGHRAECGTRAGPWGFPPCPLSFWLPGARRARYTPGRRAWEAGARSGRGATRGAWGARTEPPRALPPLPPRTAQAGRVGGGVAFPEAWTWAWRRVSRAREPPSSRPQPEGRAGRSRWQERGRPWTAAGIDRSTLPGLSFIRDFAPRIESTLTLRTPSRSPQLST